MTDDDVTESVTPLAMSVEDLINFAAPEMVSLQPQAIPSMIMRPDGIFSQEVLRKMPDELILAMAAVINDAAAEMEEESETRESLAMHNEKASWELHNQAPILGAIDRAIMDGDTSSAAYGELSSRVRGLAAKIQAGLRRQWGAWEVMVLSRMANEAGQVLSKFVQSREAMRARADELKDMISHTELAEKAVVQEKARAEVRIRITQGAEKLKKTEANIDAIRDRLANLRLRRQEMAERKAELLEAKARREAKAKAVARRSASVVRLMELETKSIAVEKEALVMKEKLDVELGLRLWCQPITLLPDRVMVAYAAPHDPTIKHQLKFTMDESSNTSATSAVMRDPDVGTNALGKSTQRALKGGGGAGVPKGGLPAVGGKSSASGRLSRLIFEGRDGLFGTRDGIGAGGEGAAVAGLGDVKTVADMRTKLADAEWFVGRAYSLLQEVHQLEKEYACTVTVGGGVDNDDAVGLSARPAVTWLCVEVANWRSKRRSIRLRFRVSTTFACTVGAPLVEVDASDMRWSVYEEAIARAGGNQAGVLSVTKAVRAAAECL
ncbi:unnamed protein product [Scytosiphon promiscuus]